MSNDYYNNNSNTLTAGSRALHSDVESKFDEVTTGFAKLPDETKLNRGTVTFADDSGAADAYVVTMHQTAASYVDGLKVVMRVSNTNTGACTINVDSLGAKSIKRQNGDTPEAGDLTSGDLVVLVYDSTNGYFVILSSYDNIVSVAQNWATQTGGTVNGSEYSAKEYAQGSTATGGTSKEWAEKAEDAEVISGSYSAYHWAQKTAKGDRLTATSSSSVTIGTGSKSFTLNESYRAFISGSKVKIAETADPTTNYMTGTVTSYSGDTLAVTVGSVTGSGTISAWSIGLMVSQETHALSHKDGGDDELDVSELAGALGTSGQVPVSDGAAVSWSDDLVNKMENTYTVNSYTSNATLASGDCTGDQIRTNRGATGEVIITLPSGTNGDTVPAMVIAAQYLRFTATDGDKFTVGGTSSAANGYIRSNTQGRFFTLVYDTDAWHITFSNGPISYDE